MRHSSCLRRWGRLAATSLIGIALIAVPAFAGPPSSAVTDVSTDAAVAQAIAADAAYKAATDTEPHGRLTAYQQRMLRLKDERVADLFSELTGGGLHSCGITSVDARALASAPAEWGVMANQHSQQQKNWCGPATLQEALEQCAYFITQRQAAIESGASLDPNGQGTPWYVSSAVGYPVPNVMNAHQKRNYYVPIAVSLAPSSAEIAAYRSRLVANIWDTYSPLIGDAWETRYSAYHLNGHPRDRTIFHWFDIFGYTNNGAYTRYEDSVHGCPVSMISWAASVPAFSRQASNQIVTICGGRGYVW